MDAFVKEYESKLWRARLLGTLVSIVYAFNWFLGFCALTWASSVILGGLLSELRPRDYYAVAVLLLLEAVRLAASTAFANVVNRALISGTTDPTKLVYDGDARRQRLLGISRMLVQAFELCVVTVSIVLPLRRLRRLGLSLHFNSFRSSLTIFYYLVAINAMVAALGVVLSKTVVLCLLPTFSLRKYYEKIVWKAMDQGLLHATDFDFLVFAFECQADEYRRNSRERVVFQLYRDMIKYLYYHPHNKGFEAAKVALGSDDTSMREAAANVVGGWISDSGDASLSRLRLQKKLLTLLADAVDHDETGRAATSSFMAMSAVDPEATMAVKNGQGEWLMDVLMDGVHDSAMAGKPDKSLVFMKVLLQIFRARGAQPSLTSSKLKQLAHDLELIVKEREVMKRVQVVAAGCLLVVSPTGLSKGELRSIAVAAAPQKKQHILAGLEQECLEELGLFPLPQDWHKVTIRSIQQPTNLPLIFRPTYFCMGTAITLIVLAAISTFIVLRT